MKPLPNSHYRHFHLFSFTIIFITFPKLFIQNICKMKYYS